MRWLGVAGDLEAAKLRVKELLESDPGPYFIFSLATGHRVDIGRDGLIARPGPTKVSPR